MIGTTIAHYRIIEQLGSGGMGVVYKARDTRLGRTVAIKVLPAGATSDSEKRRRFEQEARAAAALNHPHICTLHDIGREGDLDFLVMEYLEGESLAYRLAKGPLPLAQALEYGAHIADALARAHRHGIVHRDVKPGNVMLTKDGAKLLDFGLAKLKWADSDLSHSSAATADPATTPGTVLGTVPYMAPEQLEGKPTDARTDIFALGAVQYEMVTGKRAFAGESQASVIMAIMSAEPAPISSLQPMTPPSLERLVKRCLAKEPDGRWQSADDVADELRWIRETGAASAPTPQPSSSRRLRFALILAAALFLGVAAGVALWRALATAPILPVSRLNISLSSSGLSLTQGGVAISPDGQTTVFAARAVDGQRLYVRRVGDWSSLPLKGTEGAYGPFFSPDGGSVAFFADGKLKKAPLGSGPTETICSVALQSTAGTWGRDGRIVFSQWPNGGLCRVADGGGDT
jgi:serine/threonine protein kinase